MLTVTNIALQSIVGKIGFVLKRATYIYRFFQMVSLLVGIVYFDQRLDQDGVMNINGALFIFLTNMTFQNVFAVINVRFICLC